MDLLVQTWPTLDPVQKKSLARDVGTTYVYLSQIANGHATPSVTMERAIRQEIEIIEKLRRRREQRRKARA